MLCETPVIEWRVVLFHISPGEVRLDADTRPRASLVQLTAKGCVHTLGVELLRLNYGNNE